MKFLSALTAITILAITGSGCNQLEVANADTGKTCSFDGSWTACGNDGNASQKITITALNGSITEIIESFPGVLDCSGTGTIDLTFAASISFGRANSSHRIGGATDVTLKPTVDIFGCGAGNAAYTSIMFSDSCNEFITADGSPTCNEAGASTSLSNLVFTKE